MVKEKVEALCCNVALILRLRELLIKREGASPTQANIPTASTPKAAADTVHTFGHTVDVTLHTLTG